MRMSEKILSLVLIFSAAGNVFAQAAPETPPHETDVIAAQNADAVVVQQAQIDAETKIAAKILLSNIARSKKDDALRQIDDRLASDDPAIRQAQLDANAKAGLTPEFLDKLRKKSIICQSLPNDKGVLAFSCQ